jgi:hypothetical protein
MLERQPLKSTSDTGAQPSLEHKIASALRSDASMASAEVQQLIGEVETAAVAAAQSAEQARATALDPLNLDSARAFEAGHLAQLSCDRLRHALPLLQQQLAAALEREYAKRWSERFRRAEAMVEQAAEKFRRYPALVGELLELLNLAAQVDREVGEVNGSAPDNEHRRLRGVELTARGLHSFSVSQPSLTRDLRLPNWEESSVMLWPPPQRIDPALLVPVQLGDPRLCTDRWWEVKAEEQARERQRQQHELEAADRARREFYGQV